MRILAAAFLLGPLLMGQVFEQRGYIENRTLFFPQKAVNDRAQVTDQAQIRWEASWRPASWLKFSSSLDARADTHRQVNRIAELNYDDRTIQRPALSLRTASMNIHKGFFTGEFGRQIIRWGKTDILTPTDRFAPRDYLASVVDSDFLGVTAARVTLAGPTTSFDLIWQPWFTPSRMPLLNQRWIVPSPEAAGIPIEDAGARYPGRAQVGARWNQILPRGEFSLSVFDGYNHLPFFDANFNPATNKIRAQRYYPQMTMYGADVAIPFSWFTVKGEAGYFSSTTPATQDYVLYVVQVERQIREWSLVGGWAGEVVTRDVPSAIRFTPDRGFAKSVVGRAALTIDANRSLVVETAVRTKGSFLRFEYVQALGQHWRITPGVAWLRGDMGDFLGQYQRNSYVSLALRYSF